MRKFTLFLIFFLNLFSIWFLLDSSFPYSDSSNKLKLTQDAPTENTEEIIQKYALDKDRSVIDELRDAIGLWDYAAKEGSAAAYAQKVINYFLGILATIALFIMIIWTAKLLSQQFKETSSEKAIEHSKKYVKAAAIALILIGISWLLISFLFRIVMYGVKWT